MRPSHYRDINKVRQKLSFPGEKIKPVHSFYFLWLTLQSVGVPFLTEIALLSIVQQEWQKKKWPAIKPM